MTDQHTTRPVSSFLPSPRFLNSLFSPKTPQDSQSSPTSILSIHNPFEITQNGIKNPPEKLDREGIALALTEQQSGETVCKPNTISRKVSNLKIQIPEFFGDYGIKTRSPRYSGRPTTTPPAGGFGSPGSFSGPLSLKEMVLSEEYTRVICHGPNPKTTHIYDNCVVESCEVIGSPDLRKPGPKPTRESFLSFCHTCDKNLEGGNDILNYSEECRCQDMILDGLTDDKLNTIK